MFHLFGKKKEAEPPASPAPEHKEAKALAAQFDPEEFEIYAVTGPNGFGGGKGPKEEYWTASIGLIAWREEGGPIHQGNWGLLALADDKLLDYLRRAAPKDSVIQARVRQALKGDRFLLVGMPSLVGDMELKAILDEAVKPVTFWEEGIGTFTLDRSVNWFEAEADWLGESIRIEFDRDENRADCVTHIRALLERQKEWDEKIRSFAAKELLENAQAWAEDASEEEEDPEELTEEVFMRRMELQSIEIQADGSFDFWFGDGDMFWGHSIRVSGSLEEGPTGADMEG